MSPVSPAGLRPLTLDCTPIYTEVQCAEPKTTICIKRPRLCSLVLGSPSDSNSSFHRRMQIFFNPSAGQSNRDTVSMVSKNKEPGVALQHHRSWVCFKARSGKIRMYAQRRRPEVKSNKRPFARREVEVGMFSSLRWLHLSWHRESKKKEYASCWEVDLIFKSADGNTMHILGDGYSPVECCGEFVATGEFAETSSSARRTNRSQAPGGYSRVRWSVEGGQRATLSPFANAFLHEQWSKARSSVHDSQRDIRVEDKKPPSEKILHCPAPLSDINRHTKAASDVEAYRRTIWEAGWGDWLPDGVVSQMVLIKIWWIAPSGGLRVTRLHSKSMRRNQTMRPTQQANSSAGWNKAVISGRLLLGWVRECGGSRRVGELVILSHDGNN